MDVRLHIERLVLDGIAVTPSERASLTDAVQAELSRLVTAGGVSDAVAGGFAVPSLPAATMTAAGLPFNAREFGRDVARAVYSGIGRAEPKVEP